MNQYTQEQLHGGVVAYVEDMPVSALLEFFKGFRESAIEDGECIDDIPLLEFVALISVYIYDCVSNPENFDSEVVEAVMPYVDKHVMNTRTLQ